LIPLGVDATGSVITNEIIQHAIFQLRSRESLEGVVARLHPAQNHMALELGININLSTLVSTPTGGIPLIEDVDIVPNVVRFERNGEVLLRIINLASPHDG